MSRRRRIKKRKSRRRLAYGVIAVTFILLCFLTYFSLRQSNQTSDSNATSPPLAAIVDHLNFTGQSNPAFVEECINILESGGLTWAYYRGENVTVDFYRNLPSYGTSLIILRVHSAIMKVNGEIVLPPLLGLFTSEPCTVETAKKYPDDVLHDRLVNATFSTGGEGYFGIAPEFVEESINGEFEDAVVIMMGCEGLGYNDSMGARVPYTDMAEAFINKGAKVYIGWDGPVGVNHTDQATLDLLQSLILEKPIKDAVKGVGADPDFNSVLKFYPDGSGNYVFSNLRSSLVMNVAHISHAPRALTRSKYRTHR